MQHNTRKERAKNFQGAQQIEYALKIIDFSSNRTAIMLHKTNASTVRKMWSNWIKKREHCAITGDVENIKL